MDAIFGDKDGFNYDMCFGFKPDALSDYLTPIFSFLDTLCPKNTAIHLLKEIRASFLSYIKVGFSLDHIMKHPWTYEKLGCKKFAEFCSKYVGKSFWQCKQIIGAAKVCMRLIVNGNFAASQLPNCVAQAVPLIQFLPDLCQDTDHDGAE
jgi:hypothetical protein